VRLFSFLPNSARTVLRYALSLALLGWLATRLDWGQLAGLRALDWSQAWLGVLLAGTAYPLQAWRWQLLLAAQGITPPTRWVQSASWIAQFYNAFLPGGVAGDAVRFGYLWRLAPDRKAAAAASLLADRLLGLGSLCALAALALGLHLGWTGGGHELEVILTASLVATSLLLALGWGFTQTRRWEPLTGRLLGPHRAAQLHDAALSLGARHATLVAATGLSVATWLVDFAALWFLSRSVGLHASPLLITVAAAAAYVAASLPLSIGGHGVREGTLIAVLGWLGFSTQSHPAVLLLAAAFLAVSVGWSLFGGLVHALSLLTGWPLERTPSAIAPATPPNP
jgi:glycosyltransferase 2 family protein